MIRNCCTYFPLWRPAPTRQQILKRCCDLYQTVKADRMLFGERFNDAYAETNEQRLSVINLLIAAARMGLPVMERSDHDWQQLNAEVLVDECKSSLRRSDLRINRENIPYTDYFRLQIDFLGVRPTSKRLKFQWAAVNVQMDIDKLYEYIGSTDNTSVRTYVSRTFNKRIQDPRYVFATHRKCRVPHKLEDYQSMNDETFALMFDWFMHYMVQRWTVYSARYQDFTSFRGDGAKARRAAGAWLKAPLRDLPFAGKENTKPFVELAKESVIEITRHSLPVLYKAGRSLGIESLLRYDIRPEQLTKLKQLLEMYDEVQRPRQPEPLPESLGRDDGAEDRSDVAGNRASQARG